MLWTFLIWATLKFSLQDIVQLVGLSDSLKMHVFTRKEKLSFRLYHQTSEGSVKVPRFLDKD